MLIVNINFAQTFIDFEDLEVPEIGYFNGSTLHSGTIGSTETFEYTSFTGIFNVSYTLDDGFDYWSGTAYSNQTDLETADWTNFSAYANYPDGGGANNSDNYGFGYMYNSDTIRFDIPICDCEIIVYGAYIANSVWTYHYINGSDGSGTGTYTTGDYYKLIFRGLEYDGTYTGDEVEFYLTDFTNGNSNIISDWTWVDLTSLDNPAQIEILYSTSDEWTPSYFCIDDISIDYIDNISENKNLGANIYPNPATDYIIIKNSDNSEISISDVTGKILFKTTSDSDNFKINTSDFKTGIYFVTLKSNNQIYTQKFVKN